MKFTTIAIAGLLLAATQANNCAGNCPDNTCQACLCGTQSNYISIEDYCGGSQRWNLNCCKCIISKYGRGNTNYQHNFFGDYLGVLPIPIAGVDKVCNNIKRPTDLCDWKANFECAEHIAVDVKRSWGQWGVQAIACGCPINFDEEVVEETKEQ